MVTISPLRTCSVFSKISLSSNCHLATSSETLELNPEWETPCWFCGLNDPDPYFPSSWSNSPTALEISASLKPWFFKSCKSLGDNWTNAW